MDRDEIDDDMFEQLDGLDTLDDPNDPEDPLDRGWSPPERPRAMDGWGVTAREQAEGEGLDRRLAREVPDDWGDGADGDDPGDTPGGAGELRDREVGRGRAGRLAYGDDDGRGDDELYARDIGIDGAAASAEEAAVHLVDEERA